MKELIWLITHETWRIMISCRWKGESNDNGESEYWYEQSEETPWYWCDKDCADLGHPSVPHRPHLLPSGLVLCQNCAWPCPFMASPGLMVYGNDGCLADANVLFSIWHQVSPSWWLSIAVISWHWSRAVVCTGDCKALAKYFVTLDSERRLKWRGERLF